jgi:hypothetical protein
MSVCICARVRDVHSARRATKIPAAIPRDESPLFATRPGQFYGSHLDESINWKNLLEFRQINSYPFIKMFMNRNGFIRKFSKEKNFNQMSNFFYIV